MTEGSDPVEVAAEDGEVDLYDIATWEPRTALDRVATRVHGGLVRAARGVVILTALLILVSQFALSGLAAVVNPMVGVFTLLSVVPALALAAYVWRADVTGREPLVTVVVTFALGVLFAGFAAVLNSVANPLFEAIPLVGLALFFYVIVAPVEETVKWLAVRLYAYRTEEFSAVLDGAVYGAVAGLGFATIENATYISQQYLTAVEAGGGTFDMTLQTAAVRSLAGPGHVIYSAFAGYYLGLAKYNRENAGPIVVKGLLIAAFIHATYNTAVSYLPVAARLGLLGVAPGLAFLGFIVAYDGAAGYVLYRKIRRYRKAYRDADARFEDPTAAVEEGDPAPGSGPAGGQDPDEDLERVGSTAADSRDAIEEGAGDEDEPGRAGDGSGSSDRAG